MVMLRAVKAFRYATRQLVAGDEFEARSKDVKVLKALGRAEEAPPPPPRRGRPPKAAAPEPESEAPREPEPEPEPTHADLMARAEALGLELPAGYVRNDVLASMIEDAEKSADGER